MKKEKTIVYYRKYIQIIVLIVISSINLAIANYEVNEVWSKDLRPQIKVSCSKYSNVCKKLCDNEKNCLLKNSSCLDCISTGVKMNYLFSSIGKDISTNVDHEVSIYELLDFLVEGHFMAISPNNIYNQFDSINSDALAEKFRLLCPNGYQSPVAFFYIESRELKIQNARYVTCGDSVFKLEVDSFLLEE